MCRRRGAWMSWCLSYEDLPTWSRELPAWTPFSSLWNQVTEHFPVQWNALGIKCCSDEPALKVVGKNHRLTPKGILKKNYYAELKMPLGLLLPSGWKKYSTKKGRRYLQSVHCTVLHLLNTVLITAALKIGRNPTGGVDTSWSDRHVEVPERVKGLYK